MGRLCADLALIVCRLVWRPPLLLGERRPDLRWFRQAVHKALDRALSRALPGRGSERGGPPNPRRCPSMRSSRARDRGFPER